VDRGAEEPVAQEPVDSSSSQPHLSVAAAGAEGAGGGPSDAASRSRVGQKVKGEPRCAAHIRC